MYSSQGLVPISLSALKIAYYPPFRSNSHKYSQYFPAISSLQAIVSLIYSAFRNSGWFYRLFLLCRSFTVYPSPSQASLEYFISSWYGLSLGRTSTPTYLLIFYSISCSTTSYQGFPSSRKQSLIFASFYRIQFDLITSQSFDRIKLHSERSFCNISSMAGLLWSSLKGLKDDFCKRMNVRVIRISMTFY